MKTGLSLAALLLLVNSRAAESPARPSVVLENDVARLVLDLNGGSIGEFRLKNGVNPLSWAHPSEGNTNIQGFGHFLCLDRWGPPSDAEGAHGIPYHGEAAHVRWSVSHQPSANEKPLRTELTATLPKAGLAVRRQVALGQGAAFSVTEEVKNENQLGRMFNIVQHPTVAPPFLDEETIVDCNGTRGFAQGGTLPNPEEPSTLWPEALSKERKKVDLRRLKDDPNPNVVSYIIEGPEGWVTAASPAKNLLIGYIWRTDDYPWVSLWRDIQGGKPAARGLEFGSTGLHQPFPILARKGKIWDRPLFEYIDAGQTIAKSYTVFLLEVPADYAGTDSVHAENARITLRERGPKRREFSVPR